MKMVMFSQVQKSNELGIYEYIYFNFFKQNVSFMQLKNLHFGLYIFVIGYMYSKYGLVVLNYYT
jgi:hypothetical protein